MIEAIAVICIVGVLAARSLLMISRTLTRTQHQATITDLRNLYSRIRRDSNTQDQWLKIDLSQHRNEIVDARNEDSTHSIPFNDQQRLVKLLIHGRTIERGVELIQFRDGLCASHAIQLRSPSGRYQWLMVSGAIDSVMELQHEESTDAQLAQLAQCQAKWINAH